MLQNVEGFLTSDNGQCPKQQSCLLSQLNSISDITIITIVHHMHTLGTLSSVSHSYDILAICLIKIILTVIIPPLSQSSHLLFPRAFHTKILYTFHLSLSLCTCPTHCLLLDINTLIIPSAQVTQFPHIYTGTFFMNITYKVKSSN